MNYSSNKKIICECARCKQKFEMKDALVKTTKIYGINIKEKACPFCESISFTAMKDISWLNKYINE